MISYSKIFMVCCLYLLIFVSCDPWDLEQQHFVRVRMQGALATGLTTALAEAEILDFQFGQISDHGFVWTSATEEPTLLFNEGQKKLGVKEPGESSALSTDITGLLPGTSYRIRAYVVIQNEEIYSETIDIGTGTGSAVTESVNYESGRSLQVAGRITGVEAGILAISHGFCWSTEVAEPTLDDEFVDLGNRRSGEVFTFTLDSLIYQTKYYLRAFARLSVSGKIETFYGDVLTFDGQLKDIWELHPNLNFLSNHLFNLRGKSYFRRSCNNLLEYDPVTGEMTEKQFEEFIPLCFEPQFLRSFAAQDKGYLIEPISRQVWEYDPVVNQWNQQAPVPLNRFFINTICLGFQGSGFFGLGHFIEDAPPQGSSTWWSFDPSRQCGQDETLPGCWREEVTFMPVFNAISLTFDQKIYMGMGMDYDTDLNGEPFKILYASWWAYDPATRDWDRKSDFPGRLGSAEAGFSAQDQGYVIGDELWLYIPDTDTWEKRASPPAYSTVNEVIEVGDRAFLWLRRLNGDRELWEYVPN